MPRRRESNQIDWLVITASSRAQAAGYRRNLRERASRGAMASVRRWLVVPDPHDKRAGSGNATLVAIARVLAARLAELRRERKRPSSLDAILEGQRLLIIHSGGDSRRLPAYAACGKLFLPLDRRDPSGTPLSMFDLILRDLVNVHLRGTNPGSTLIASGDVLLNASAHTIDLTSPGITGVAFPAPVETAMRHGVYVHDASGRVTTFLQKPDHEAMRREGALTRDGHALVDSGIVVIDKPTVLRLVRSFGLTLDAGRERLRFKPPFARIIDASSPPMDLYADVLLAAAGESSDFPMLTKMLRSVHFNVRIIPSCDFLHVGTTAELLSLAISDRRLRDTRNAAPGPVVLATVGRSRISADANCWIDACSFQKAARFQGDNVAVGLETDRPFSMPHGWGVVILPLTGGGFASIAFGKSDDFKTPIDHGGTLGGKPLIEQVRRVERVSITDRECSLYDAPLWPVAKTRKDALRSIEWMWSAHALPSSAWLRAPRISVAEAVRTCDHASMIEHRCTLASQDAAEAITRGTMPDGPPAAFQDLLPRDAAGALAACSERAKKQTEPTARASTLWIASDLARLAGRDPAPLRDRAMACVAEAVERSAAHAQRVDRKPTRAEPILPSQASWASSPARIDLAGGWSDTPPICHELGGTVVNAAVRVGGHAAVHAIVMRTERPGITITSTDLGRTTSIRAITELRLPFDPTRWASLACAAIALNAESDSPPRSVDEVCRRMWDGPGGLHVTTYSTLPKGSGLGTSSILGATLLAALADACGRRMSVERLFAQTLRLEQMLGTGGGWQDQAGGLTPGVKLLTTSPGFDQVPRVSTLSDRLFSDPDGPRMLLYFTGERRMARGILRGVVGRYLARDPRMLHAVVALKDGAIAMADAVKAGNQSEITVRLAEYWSLKRAADSGASLPSVESITHTLRDHLAAWELPGAGGGGYLFMIARDADAEHRIRNYLRRNPLNAESRFADVEIDVRGLTVLRT
ncbi:MAG: hypothetical protein KF838_05845 [Phycisphaeraceae bacterium]|nr:MAG: hypothetical protein KF838_05845 [Phycisphaeraceae bacterium]